MVQEEVCMMASEANNDKIIQDVPDVIDKENFMKNPDVFKGMKIIRGALVLKAVSSFLIMLTALISLLPAGILTPGSSLGSKLAIFILVALPLGLLFAALSIFRLLRGCRIAGSADDNFNNARFILFVALLCNIAAAVFTFTTFPKSLLFSKLCIAGSAVCESISVFFIVKSANRFLAENGETVISSGTVRTIALIVSLLLLSALMQMISALFSNAGIFAIWMQVIGSVLGMASTVIYNIYLFKAVKALNGMQDA